MKLRADATASVSNPAKTVVSFVGFFSFSSDNFTPGRAAPAAQPHTEFINHIGKCRSEKVWDK